MEKQDRSGLVCRAAASSNIGIQRIAKKPRPLQIVGSGRPLKGMSREKNTSPREKIAMFFL